MKCCDMADTWDALTGRHAASMLKFVSKERIRDELERMLTHDTIRTINLLGTLPDATQRGLFPEGLRLSATMKKG